VPLGKRHIVSRIRNNSLIAEDVQNNRSYNNDGSDSG
jgi:hypothetical protein